MFKWVFGKKKEKNKNETKKITKKKKKKKFKRDAVRLDPSYRQGRYIWGPEETSAIFLFDFTLIFYLFFVLFWFFFPSKEEADCLGFDPRPLRGM